MDEMDGKAQSCRRLCALIFNGFRVSRLPVSSVGSGHCEGRKEARHAGAAGAHVRVRGIIYVEETRGGRGQHCRGTRLSYKHILLGRLRTELLAWLWPARQKGGKGYCLQPQGSCANRGRLPLLRRAVPGAVGFFPAAGTRRNE